MNTKTHISVAIPSYNAQDQLRPTLNALVSQRCDFAYEIIVVDCSEHDLVKQLCAEYDGVRYHHESTRFNPGIGRNIGAKLASGELMVFVDSDVVLAPDALSQAWDYYQRGHAIFGGALELNEAHAKGAASYLEHYFFNHESQKGRPECDRANLSSALMIFQRELFLQVGGFKDIPRMQDTELTERMLAAGHALRFTPDVLGYQTQDSPMAKVLRKILIGGRNLYFIRYQQQGFAKKAALFLLLPFLSSFKILRIIARHFRYQSTHGRIVTLVISPLLFLGGLYWAVGLYRSMIFGGEISKKRD